MTKKFNYDFTNKAIVGSKTAIIRANKGQNPEYSQLSAMLAVHPDYEVKEKLIKKNSSKRSYKSLTLSRMEDYIRTQFVDEKVRREKLNEFEAIKTIAEIKGAKYPLTKKWFLATYTDYKESEVKEAETAALIKAAADKEETIKTKTIELKAA